MKKIFSISFLLLLFILVGCSVDKQESTTNEESNTTAVDFNQDQTLAFSAYLASGMLQASDSSVQNMSYTPMNFNLQLLTTTTSEELKIETELDEVNVYFDKLKVFLDEGFESTLNINEQESTIEGYDTEVSFTIDDVTYTIYYSFEDQTVTNDNSENQTTTENDDEEDSEDEDNEFRLNGLIVIDGVEYELIGAREQEENEEKLWFRTQNKHDAGNYVRVEMKTEDNEQKFDVQTVIDGVEKRSQIKFEQEENETKVQLKLNNNGEESKYTFKKEIEDSQTVYKFSYEFNDAKGNVKIFENVDENGNISYIYKIDENGKTKDIEKNKERNKHQEENKENNHIEN